MSLTVVVRASLGLHEGNPSSAYGRSGFFVFFFVVVFPGFSGLRSTLMNSGLRSLLMNDRLDM